MFLIIFILASVLYNVYGELQCEDNGGVVHFVVSSTRNITGHRNIGAKMAHRHSNGSEEIDIDMDIFHTWGQCGVTKYHQLELSAVSSPRSAVSSPGSPVRSVAAGYEYFPGVGYYKVHTVMKSWADAHQVCRSEGGHLMVINSEAEADVYREFYKRNIPGIKGTGSWIGFHDQFKYGDYITVLGDSLSESGYEKWNRGQPNTNKHCGSMYELALLDTWNCDAVIPFFCEGQF